MKNVCLKKSHHSPKQSVCISVWLSVFSADQQRIWPCHVSFFTQKGHAVLLSGTLTWTPFADTVFAPPARGCELETSPLFELMKEQLISLCFWQNRLSRRNLSHWRKNRAERFVQHCQRPAEDARKNKNNHGWLPYRHQRARVDSVASVAFRVWVL